MIEKLTRFLESRRVSAVIIGVVSFVLIYLLSFTQIYTEMRYTLNDLRFAFKQDIPEYDNLTIVEIDDNSLHQIGEFPWPRRFYAKGLSVLQRQGVEGVTFDIEFSEKSSATLNKDYLSVVRQSGSEMSFSGKNILQDLILDNDKILATAFAKYDNIALPYSFQSYKDRHPSQQTKLTSFQKEASIAVPAQGKSRYSSLKYHGELDKIAAPNAKFRQNISDFGFVNSRFDADGTMRRMQLVQLFEGRLYFHLSVVMLAEMTDTDLADIRVAPGEYIELPEAANPVTYKMEDLRIPINEKGEIVINWAGDYNSAFQHLPFLALLEYDNYKSAVHNNLKAFAQASNKKGYLNLKAERDFLLETVRSETDKASRLSMRRKLDEVNKKYLAAMDELVAPLRQQTQKMDKDNPEYQNNMNFIEAFQVVREVEKTTNNNAIIGLTGTGTQDIGVTPTSSEFWMVGVYHNILNMFLQQRFITSLPAWLAAVVFLVLAVALSLWLNQLSARRSLVTLALTLLVVNGAAIAMFAVSRVAIDQIGLNLAVILPGLAIIGIKFLSEENQKKFIKSAFAQYLSPKVIDRIVDNPDALGLGGETREITSFFSDVAGFSTISESLTAQELTALLNEFLTEMTDLVLEAEGTVDKYEGDAIIAFFGAPAPLDNHAYNACLTAVRMQRKLVELRKKWHEEGKHELYVRMGMNSGSAMVGNMGSSMRMDYTALGDTVNLAARLEGANKHYKIYTMISSNTYEMVKDDFDVRELDRIRVVGRDEPITVYELLETKGNLSEQKRKVIDLYHEGLALFRGQKWQEAEELFNQVLAIDENDGPASVFVERCREYSKNPPAASWKGVYKLDSK